MTESNVASTSAIRLSSRAILPLRAASLSRVVLSAQHRRLARRNGQGVKKVVLAARVQLGGARVQLGSISLNAVPVAALRRTKVVKKLGQLLDPELNGVGQLPFLPITLHIRIRCGTHRQAL